MLIKVKAIKNVLLVFLNLICYFEYFFNKLYQTFIYISHFLQVNLWFINQWLSCLTLSYALIRNYLIIFINTIVFILIDEQVKS